MDTVRGAMTEVLALGSTGVPAGGGPEGRQSGCVARYSTLWRACGAPPARRPVLPLHGGADAVAERSRCGAAAADQRGRAHAGHTLGEAAQAGRPHVEQAGQLAGGFWVEIEDELAVAVQEPPTFWRRSLKSTVSTPSRRLMDFTSDPRGNGDDGSARSASTSTRAIAGVFGTIRSTSSNFVQSAAGRTRFTAVGSTVNGTVFFSRDRIAPSFAEYSKASTVICLPG